MSEGNIKAKKAVSSICMPGEPPGIHPVYRIKAHPVQLFALFLVHIASQW
jgi:hypothetical protein